MFKNANFIDDYEKMKDFCELSKEEFLLSYSYLTEEEYDNTMRLVLEKCGCVDYEKEFYKNLLMEQQEQM